MRVGSIEAGRRRTRHDAWRHRPSRRITTLTATGHPRRGGTTLRQRTRNAAITAAGLLCAVAAGWLPAPQAGAQIVPSSTTSSTTTTTEPEEEEETTTTTEPDEEETTTTSGLLPGPTTSTTAPDESTTTSSTAVEETTTSTSEARATTTRPRQTTSTFVPPTGVSSTIAPVQPELEAKTGLLPWFVGASLLGLTVFVSILTVQWVRTRPRSSARV